MTVFLSNRIAFQNLYAHLGESKVVHFQMSRFDVTLSGPGFESQKAAFQKLFADFGESKMVHFRMSRSDVTLSGPGFESQRAAFQKLFADFGESKMVHFRMSRSDVTHRAAVRQRYRNVYIVYTLERRSCVKAPSGPLSLRV